MKAHWLPRAFMLTASLFTAGALLFPLWRIDLRAPQYPESLGLYIYVHGLAPVHPGDLQKIDILNHYVGMKPLPKPEEMWEFQTFPFITGGLALLGVLFALLGKEWLYLVWAGTWIILGSLGLYDFYLWLYEYGTDLDPRAPIKLVDEAGNPIHYVPPLLGYKQILNFEVFSYPVLGAFMLAGGILLAIGAYGIARRQRKKAVISHSAGEVRASASSDVQISSGAPSPVSP